MSVKNALSKLESYKQTIRESELKYKEFGSFILHSIKSAIENTDFDNTQQVLDLQNRIEEIRKKNYDEEFYVIPVLDMYINTIIYELFDAE